MRPSFILFKKMYNFNKDMEKNTTSQIESNSQIKELVSNVHSDGIELIFDVLKIVHKNLKADYQSSEKLKYFRRRTAAEIFVSGVSYGCTDHALATLALLKEKGVKAQYIEAFARKWLEQGGENVEGHVFIEVEIDGHIYIIDAERASIMKWYNRYVVYKKGNDSWDIGIENFEDMKRVAYEFQQDYLSQQEKR